MRMTKYMQFAFLLTFIALCLVLTGLNGYGIFGIFLLIPALVFGVIDLSSNQPPSP